MLQRCWLGCTDISNPMDATANKDNFGHKKQEKNSCCRSESILNRSHYWIKGLGKKNRDWKANKSKNSLKCTNQDLVPPWTFASFMSLGFGWEVKSPSQGTQPVDRVQPDLEGGHHPSFILQPSHVPVPSCGFLLLWCHKSAIDLA